MTPSSEAAQSKGVLTVRRGVLVLTVVASASACWPGAPEVGPLLEVAAPSISGPSAPFSELQEKLFKPDCASSLCHSGNPPAHAPLSLDDDVAWDSLVNRPASQSPSILEVRPGAPDQSYLMLKLLGTVGASGSVSTRMPLNREAVDDVRIAAVRAWIERGAPND
jgi:hypothetical protein